MSQKKPFQIDPIQLFSHELKTPLSSLQLGLGLLKKQLSSPKEKEILDLMEQEVKHMIHLISHQLDLKYLEQKEDLMNLAWFSWKKLAQQVLKSFQNKAEQKKITFQINSQAIHVEVFGDFTWLGQALRNLISNAIQYSPPHSTIIMEALLKDKGLLFRIKNKKLQDSTQNPNQETPFKPHNLGLKITQMIIDHHKGTLDISSSEDFSASLFLPQIRAEKKSI